MANHTLLLLLAWFDEVINLAPGNISGPHKQFNTAHLGKTLILAGRSLLSGERQLTGTGMESGVGVTWEYIFMGTGMKTGTGMGTGTYSLFTPSSTSADTSQPDYNCEQ